MLIVCNIFSSAVQLELIGDLLNEGCHFDGDGWFDVVKVLIRRDDQMRCFQAQLDEKDLR